MSPVRPWASGAEVKVTVRAVEPVFVLWAMTRVLLSTIGV
jgi:hypothetical protein